MKTLEIPRARTFAMIHGPGRRGVIMGLLLGAPIAVAALLAPVLPLHDPLLQTGVPLAPPSGQFLLGTDELGRDILSRLIYGGRVTLLIGIGTVVVGASVGGMLGVVAGYFGGASGSVVMRVMDVILAFPAIVLGLAVAAILGPSELTVFVAIAVSGIPVFARLTRAGTLAIRHSEFMEAAITAGAGPLFTIRRHVLRNVAPLILVQVGISIAYAMLLETSLSYLGLGAQPPTPSWGRMLERAQVTLHQSPLYAIMPGLALTIVVVSVNLIVDGLRDAIDPRLSRMRIAELEKSR